MLGRHIANRRHLEPRVRTRCSDIGNWATTLQHPRESSSSLHCTFSLSMSSRPSTNGRATACRIPQHIGTRQMQEEDKEEVEKHSFTHKLTRAVCWGSQCEIALLRRVLNARNLIGCLTPAKSTEPALTVRRAQPSFRQAK